MGAGLVIGIVIGIVLGLVVGFLVAAVATERRRSAAEAAQQADAARLEKALAQAEGRLEQQQEVAVQRERDWEEARQQLVNEFARLSKDALASNNEQFLQLADLKLDAAREQAQSDLTQRQEAIGALVRPLGDQLQRYEQQVHRLEQRRDHAYQELLTKVTSLDDAHRDLEREARNLASALRSPSARGRWGELQLRKVVELAGMMAHCDFELQVTTGPEGERLRPDMVVNLPGGKHVVVDAKVPLEAFQSAVACEGEEERATLMAGHARQLRAHVEALSKKEYWRRFDPSPELVVAFIPGDPLLTAAFEHDAGLMEFAVARGVMLATPITLITLLRTVAYSWQQDALADNAKEVQRLGADLYQRLSTMGDHLAKLGRSLQSSVKSYNEAVGSLETRVLPTARRFPQLGVVGDGAGKAPPQLEPLEVVPRPLQAPELVEEGSVVALRSAEVPAPELPASGHG